MAATRRFEINSTELQEVTAIAGTATPLEEKPTSVAGSTAPSFYQRRFELSSGRVIHGEQAGGESFTFSGYTLLSPNQRAHDPHSPTLSLAGQAFFDSALPDGPVEVLLLVGGPELGAIPGLMGNTASVEDGPRAGQAVRALPATGADATLPEALPSLVGWQPAQTMETAQAALAAPHPLVAVDALRVAARSGNHEQAAVLAERLLHPGQPAAVKAAVVTLVGEAVTMLPAGSAGADRLLAIAVAAWEGERQYDVDAAYLRAFQTAAGHIKQSNQLEQVRTIADGFQAKELTDLASQLKRSLRR